VKQYPRYITKGFHTFDPIVLAKETEALVCKGNMRKYTGFSMETDKYGGVVTAHSVGCCLRCFFCWSNKSRDFPERYGTFYSPEEVFKKLDEVATRTKVNTLRISGAEPTICREHLLEVLEYVEDSKYDFVLETNGILLADESYVKQLSTFKKPTIRLSIKAGDASGFVKRTGASPEKFELPFQAAANLVKYGVKFLICISSDPRIMSERERLLLIEKLEAIDPVLISNIDEETLLPFKTSLERMRHSGLQCWSLLFPFEMTNVFRRIPNEQIRKNIKRLIRLVLT